MAKKIFLIFNFVFISSTLLVSNVNTANIRKSFNEGVKAARSGKIDFAYMHFSEFLRNNPESELAQEALFAIGEYHFFSGSYNYAYSSFDDLLGYPRNDLMKLFALAYQFEIAKKDNIKKKLKEIEKEIGTFQKVTFLFRDFKEHAYNSPLNKQYKAKHFIDKIEFYIDGKFFTEVPY